MDEGGGDLGPLRRSICLYEALESAESGRATRASVALAGRLTVHDGGGGKGLENFSYIAHVQGPDDLRCCCLR